MTSISYKIICLAGGWLWLVVGCSPAAVFNSGPTSTQDQTNITITPDSGHEAVLTATVATPDSVAAAMALLVTPAPVSSPTPVATPTPAVPPLPIPIHEGPPYTYHTIAEGQTLGYIALLYNSSIEELVVMNDLDGPSALIQTGQLLRVPLQINNILPATPLIPDSEVVYSPAYVNFDITGFVNGQGGYLSTYYENVDGQELTGPQVVERVAQQFSVGPRLLLALLEHYGGWVTQLQPMEEQLRLPLGPRNPKGGSLYQALSFTANRINAGYYGYKRDGFWVFCLPDRSRAMTSPGVNAGTVGVQNILAIHSDWPTWQQEIGPNGFMAHYCALFGDPFTYAVEPVVPITLTQPPLSLPWARGEGFYFTGAPHPAYADGSAWAAIDFGPPDVLGNCYYSAVPSTAAADGVIVVARQGEVQLDLDGDGNIQTGWVLLYLHVALDVNTPVQVGQRVAQGDIIGYASCEGGLSNSSHVHFARRYNGEWLDAGGPVPLILSGWEVQPNLFPYEGLIIKGPEVREACQCWDAERNLIVNTE
ncbi:MAG: LysM peptidoglycan-binding domain-containing M23 family metallopeptidase [Anaerolineae bacterium]|nr:LysM peptidoglycan-binding domain-containing M23 family metallopeptidase [Anaerolineae bacterium]